MPSHHARFSPAHIAVARLLAFALLVTSLTTAHGATNVDEYAVFARAFTQSIPLGQARPEEWVDLDAMGKRISAQLPQNAMDERQAHEAAKASATGLIDSLRGSRMHVLRVRHENGHHLALLRLLAPHHAKLNYLELELEMREMKRVKIVDIYSMLLGQQMSESAREVASAVPLKKRQSIVRLLQPKSAQQQNAQAIVGVVAAFQKGDFKRVLQIIEELPAEVQRQKNFVFFRAQAAEKVGVAEFAAAARFWRVNYPKDPAVDLISIDAFAAQKKYDLALDAVERLDKSIGGDPYLDGLRATFYEKLGSNELAKAASTRFRAYGEAEFRASTPNFVSGRDLLISRENTVIVPKSVRMAARSSTSSANPADVSRPVVAATNSMKLQGVFMRAGSPSAIINGKSVSEGDFFEGSKVVKIETSRVTLENTRGELINLSFQ